MADMRPAAPGELCTCGRQAAVVYLFEGRPPVGHCDPDQDEDVCPTCTGGGLVVVVTDEDTETDYECGHCGGTGERKD